MKRAILVVEALLVVIFGVALADYVSQLPPSVPLRMPLPLFVGSRMTGAALVILLAHLGIVILGWAFRAPRLEQRLPQFAVAAGLLIAAMIGSVGLLLISFSQY